MKLTKELEAEIKQVMDDYWDSYLKGDLETWANFLPDNYMNIGSTEEEIWNNKEEMIAYSKAVVHQMVGTVEIRNRQLRVIPLEPYFIVHEFQDFFIKTGSEWAFYSKFRLSSILQKTDKGWKVIHQHGSVPDSKAQEGETIGFQKISKENLELRDAVKRRTVELEYKNHELEIEASLERVRTVAMAMKNSIELKDLIGTVYTELTRLDMSLNRCFIMIFDNKTMGMTWWMAGHEAISLEKGYYVKYHEHPAYLAYIKPWQERREKWKYLLGGQEKKDWDEFLFSQTELAKLPDFVIASMKAVDTAYISASFHNFGCLTLGSIEPLKDESFDILLRFTKVFDQTYTRFLDLQKAEEQAREAQIETALERVRSRTMAMQKSEELGQVSHVINAQLQQLNFKNFMAGFFMDYSHSDDFNVCRSDSSGLLLEKTIIPYFDHPVFNRFIHAKNAGLDFYDVALAFEEKNKWVGHALIYLREAPPEVKEFLYTSPGYAISCALLKNVGLFIENFDGIPFSKEENAILMRFGKVFEQTYIRFLDLQKAEAQAREAKIETALERVRTRTMGMQKSDELREVVAAMYEQLQFLDITFGACTIIIIDRATNDMEHWVGGFGQKIYPESYYVPYFKHPLYDTQLSQFKNGEKYGVFELSGESKKSYDAVMFAQTDFKNFPEAEKKWMQEIEQVTFSMAYMNHGALTWGPGAISEEYANILQRFAKVFEQTYTRFLDLEKAEAQAREAQIEVSLERVRSKAMAMQKSEDLANAVATVFDELDKLNLGMLRCGIGILNKEKRSADVWTTTKSDNDTVVQVSGDESMDIHPLLQGAFQAWLNQADHSYVLKGEDLNNYYKALTGVNFRLPDSQSLVTGAEGVQQYYFNAVFSSGGLFAFRETDFPEEAKTILKRFADVFNLTYTRFNDLKQAEAQAREAKIEASLERVRSKAMAMHSSGDLAATIANFYHELELFSITPRRCGVGLLNRETRIAELSTMNTNEQGKSIEIIGKIKMEGHPVLEAVYENWLLNKEYHPVLRGNEIKEYYQLLRPQIAFPDYPGDTVQYGYFFFFPEGGVYAWTDKQMAEDELKIYRRFTSVLSLTYKRYKDLQQAEELAQQAEQDLENLKVEKKKTEDALTELKTTQFQLVQAEKMASLGELTAGIAHEIQNPLNFVNNFSEVNSELIDEMNAEIEKGAIAEARAIAADIRQNLEKINHHGKRADAIVKGMLQHSRNSTNATKEPADVNQLADEYLRLAYHGLRAKDKTFNATIKTDFDKTIGEVNIVPQDIGRVLLNLINNAFYTIGEKKKLNAEKYEPTVSVATKESDGKIEISVADNGHGIPQKILDKIFQPFFTTKPTGQGTGLGLSLAYDIVKAHGGELRVETAEGEGTTFIIGIPVIK